MRPPGASRGGFFAFHATSAGAATPLPVLWLLRLLRSWLGSERAVLMVQRCDAVRTLKLRDDLPVSVRENTDGSIGIAVGHDDDGEALLADLRALMG